MAKKKVALGHSEKDTEFGRELIASAKEALAHRRVNKDGADSLDALQSQILAGNLPNLK